MENEKPNRRPSALAAVLCVFLAGQGMAEPLTRPATVPLDFLTWIGRDAGWLVETLEGQGFGAAVAQGKDGLTVTTSEALRAVNRIRAFAHLAAPGIRPPYMDLMLNEPGGAVTRCTTLFAKSVVPGIGPFDFDRPALSPEGGDGVALDLCRVDPAKGAAFQGLSREDFRNRYFDAASDLRVEFIALNKEPAFLAAAFDLGFFLRQGDVTGRIRLDPE